MATSDSNASADGHSASSLVSSTGGVGQTVIAQPPIAQPFVAEVENVGATSVVASPTSDIARRWGHDVRNAFNTIRLCTFAFEVCDGLSEQLEMLDQVERAAGHCAQLMDGPQDEPTH